jgi:hypothetical protein
MHVLRICVAAEEDEEEEEEEEVILYLKQKIIESSQSMFGIGLDPESAATNVPVPVLRQAVWVEFTSPSSVPSAVGRNL